MKIRNVSGEDRNVPGLGRLVLAGAVVDVPEDDVWAYTQQEPNWAPADDDAQRVHDRAAKAHAGDVDDTTPTLPGKNASTEAWADYAVAAGLATSTDVEGKSRDELINLYGPQEG